MVVFYTPKKTVSAGVAHVLRLRTASRMRTFIWSLDVEEITSLMLTDRFKWDCACAPFCACVLSFGFWTSMRAHRCSYYVFTVFKRDSACAPFCACVVSFQLWEPKRTHRSGLLREPITMPYVADIIIAWIYLTLLLYKKVSSDDVINC